MFQSIHKLRVRYAETDRMGYSYYGNYAEYFEVARVEALRELDLSYKEIEDSGIILPVRDFSVRYFKPAYYDDEITIETCIPEMPNTRLKFDYIAKNQKGEVICKGSTTLVFVDNNTKRPMAAPAYFIDRLKEFFNS